MNKTTTFIIQLVGELLIPLLGYFFWNWSLPFILFFYLIESLFFSFFRIETIREIKKLILKKDQPVDSKTRFKALILWMTEFILIHLFIILLYPKKSLTQEWIDFILFQDLGVPQGIILLPLLYFVSKLKMKHDVFVSIKNLKSLGEINLIKVNFRYNWLAIGTWGVLIGLNYFIQIHELLNLTFILVLFIFRNIQKN